jgi:hypothetical protein
LIQQILARSTSPKTSNHVIFSGISLIPTVTIELCLGVTARLYDKCYNRI